MNQDSGLLEQSAPGNMADTEQKATKKWSQIRVRRKERCITSPS